MNTDFVDKTETEWQVGCVSYFCHAEDHSSVLLPVRVYCPFGGWKTSLCFLCSQRRLTFMIPSSSWDWGVYAVNHVLWEQETGDWDICGEGVCWGFCVCANTNNDTNTHTRSNKWSHWPLISLLLSRFTAWREIMIIATVSPRILCWGSALIHSLTQKYINTLTQENKYPKPHS